MTNNTETEFNFGTLDGFIQLWAKYGVDVLYGGIKAFKGIYCPTCGDSRRVEIQYIHMPNTGKYGNNRPFHDAVDANRIPDELLKRLGEILVVSPILIRLECVQCKTRFSVLIYEATEGKIGYFVMPNSYAGVATPRTDTGVAYYLDQAYKAQSVGANSAAVAMYRGALEHLLFSHGYKKGMLGKKLEDFEQSIKDKTAPPWAYTLDTEYLDIIKELGNGAIHPNNGDVTLQTAIDSELLQVLDITFSGLLYYVYEAPLCQRNKSEKSTWKGECF